MSHSIYRQQYEIALAHSSEAAAYQSSIGSLQEQRINTVLQNVLDQCHHPEYCDEYDQITLDIGTISAVNFDTELPLKIEEALAAFLKGDRYPNGDLKTGKRKHIEKKHLERFAFFLNHGYLPWDTSSKATVSNLFQGLVLHQKEELISLLKELGKKATIRKRLVTQLDTPHLEQIVTGVAKEEGVYINQYRRRVEKQQQHDNLIEIGFSDFRTAIWEITLRYIFTEVKANYSRKSFLRHLITTTAQKYNLAYQSLLQAMAPGIQEKGGKNRADSDFGQLIQVLLQEELPKTESTFQLPSEPAPTADFREYLQYYIKYHSLPPEAPYHVRSKFYEHLEKMLAQEPDALHAFLQGHIRNKADAIKLLAKLPEPILHKIALPSPLIAEIKSFLEKINSSAKQSHITSRALAQLHKNWRKIALYTYYTTTGRFKTIEEFLVQMVAQQTIDAPLVALLQVLSSENPPQWSPAIRSFLREATLSEKQNNTSPEALSKSTAWTQRIDDLYKKYASKSALSPQAFRQQLEKATTESLALAKLLLEVGPVPNQVSIQDVAAWMHQRQQELEAKGKPVKKIAAELAKILQLLGAHSSLLEGIKQASEEDMAKSQQAQCLAAPVIQELITALYKQLYDRHDEALQPSMQAMILAFAKENKMPATALFAQLQQHVAAAKQHRMLHKLLSQMPWEEAKAEKADDLPYKTNLVLFFLNHGRLPWWARPAAKDHLKSYLRQVVANTPALFKAHILNAKNPQKVLALLDTGTYEILLQHAATVTHPQGYPLKKALDRLWKNYLAGIRSLTQQQQIQLRVLLLQHAVSSKQTALPETLMFQLADLFDLNPADLKHLMAEVMLPAARQEKATAAAAEVLQPAEKKEASSETETELVTLAPGEKLLTALQRAYREQPETMRSLLKQSAYRNQWLVQLDDAAQTTLLQSLLPPAAQAQWEAVLHLFRQLKKQSPTATYQKSWEQFINFTLLKIAVDNPVRWTTKTWALLVHTHLVPLDALQGNGFAEPREKLPQRAQKIVEEVRKLLPLKATPVPKELPISIEKLAALFTTSSLSARKQKSLLAMMDENTYETLIKNISTITNQALDVLKKKLDQFLETSITGIRPITWQHRIRLRVLLLQHAATGQSPALTDTLIIQLAKLFDLQVADLKHLMEEASPSRTQKKMTAAEDESLQGTEEWTPQQKKWTDVLKLASGERLLTTLQQAYHEQPETMRSFLKQLSYRKQWLVQLDDAAQTTLLQSLLPPAAQAQWEAILHLFRQLKKQSSTAAYQKSWAQFMNFTLLKVAIDNPVRWTVKTWALLVHASLAPLETLQENELAELKKNLPESAQKIVEEVKKLAVALPQSPSVKKEVPLPEEPEVLPDESILIKNAGMVLLGPYIPMLFERAALVENGAFKDESSRKKAIGLLQYAVTGQEKHEEHDLVLNKVLCGVPLHTPLDAHLAVTAPEKQQVEGMLQAIIANWKLLQNTSVAGLRETFLCREGQLTLEEEKDVLRVEQNSFDMLLDHIPWGISKHKFTWMTKVLEVVWRP